MSTTSGCRDTQIKKIEFVARTHLLCVIVSIHKPSLIKHLGPERFDALTFGGYKQTDKHIIYIYRYRSYIPSGLLMVYGVVKGDHQI